MVVTGVDPMNILHGPSLSKFLHQMVVIVVYRQVVFSLLECLNVVVANELEHDIRLLLKNGSKKVVV